VKLPTAQKNEIKKPTRPPIKVSLGEKPPAIIEPNTIPNTMLKNTTAVINLIFFRVLEEKFISIQLENIIRP
jgi:hypothetical protein